jgi:hypothetical protein
VVAYLNYIHVTVSDVNAELNDYSIENDDDTKNASSLLSQEESLRSACSTNVTPGQDDFLQTSQETLKVKIS